MDDFDRSLMPLTSHLLSLPASPIPINESLLYNRNYQRVLQQVTIYDGPNGNPIGTLERA